MITFGFRAYDPPKENGKNERLINNKAKKSVPSVLVIPIAPSVELISS